MSNDRPKNWRPGRMTTDPARLVALDVLEQVRHGAYANIALPQTLRKAGISGRGRGFATNLTYGTLRMQGKWDAIIARCVAGRDFDDIDPLVLDILRLGAHQLLDMKVPLHAAMNETVNMARNEAGTGASGFVNAVMHRISERTPDDWDDLLAEELEPDGQKAVLGALTSHPQWIIDRLEESLVASGRPAADLGDVLAANNDPALVALAPRDISSEEIAAQASEWRMPNRPGDIVSGAVVLERGNPGRLPAVRDHGAGVQDEGSQLVALIAAYAPLKGSDKAWLDLCAGPGGKAASLAREAKPRGAQLFANEQHGHRLDLVAQAVEPYEDIVVLREGDGRELGELEPNRFDRVLVDVPCSGLGSLRRRPEARWVKHDGDAANMSPVQLDLLRAAIACARPSGIIVYATCSPDLRETREIVDQATGVEVLDAVEIARSVAVPGSLDTVHGPYLQLWPDEHDTDGMFAAVFRKLDKGATEAADTTSVETGEQDMSEERAAGAEDSDSPAEPVEGNSQAGEAEADSAEESDEVKEESQDELAEEPAADDLGDEREGPVA